MTIPTYDMQKIKPLLISSLIAISFLASAQDHDNDVHYSLENMQNGFGAGEFFKTPDQSKYFEIEGSPYYDQEYYPAIIQLKDNQFTIDKARYNIYGERLEIVMNGSNYDLFLNEVQQFDLIREFDTLSFRKINSEGLRNDIFYQEIRVSSEVNFYIGVSIFMKKPTYNYKLAKGDKNAKFIRNEAFYLRSSDQLAEITRKADLNKFFDKKSVNSTWEQLDYCDLDEFNCIYNLISALN